MTVTYSSLMIFISTYFSTTNIYNIFPYLFGLWENSQEGFALVCLVHRCIPDGQHGVANGSRGGFIIVAVLNVL